MTEKGQLKRLGFVETYSKASVDLATGYYTSAKVNFLPKGLKIRLEKAEAFAGDATGPTYKKLLSTSKDFLAFADDKVDDALASGTKLLNSTIKDIKGVAEPEVLKSHLNSARDAVSANTNKAVDFFKAHGLVGSTQYIVSEGVAAAKRVVGYGLAQGRNVVDSAQVTSKSAADFTVAKGQSFIDLATKKSRDAHDAVVKQPLYKNAYERTNDIVTAAQDTKVYKATINRIYPIVAPVYNPAYERIEPFYKSTVNYWKPVTAAA